MGKECCKWMRGSFGISVHWTSLNDCQGGKHLPYEESVNNFNTEAFADKLESLGAQHCIFTLDHAEHYLAMPCPVLDKILPGRTTKRDMVADLIASLKKRNIRFIAYYNHTCNGGQFDRPWMDATGYSKGIHGDLDAFAGIIRSVVAYIGNRYGSGIDAWWFDSPYSLDPRGKYNGVTCEMGDWQFPWDDFVHSAKEGYSGRAVAINCGVGSRYLYSKLVDYYPGETVKLNERFSPKALPDIQDTRWICNDSPNWLFAGELAKNGFVKPQFSDDDFLNFCRKHLSAGRMVTTNILIDQPGTLNPHACAQIKRIRKKF